MLQGKPCNTHRRDDTYKVLIAKLERQRPLGRSRHRWEYNIKMDLKNRVAEYGLDSNGSG
jgi:hypothetical protein